MSINAKTVKGSGSPSYPTIPRFPHIGSDPPFADAIQCDRNRLQSRRVARHANRFKPVSSRFQLRFQFHFREERDAP
ncbi:hypothetical protein [Burkholderia sp. SRS-W-2-2016]|uniref:hypothetical protein n=1 Tax=Burkholderia sp. SRS-W-2-2016 TaxID=1926878 RepID=UPI000A477C29|nr:hypothetical protein [Burkholderia sp. SRS-W-2-2016]